MIIDPGPIVPVLEKIGKKCLNLVILCSPPYYFIGKI